MLAKNLSLKSKINLYLKFSLFTSADENGEFFTKLKILVEDTYNTNNKSAVTFIVHSMGGSMTLQFLKMQTQKWKDTYIKRMISLSSPWGGAVKALKVFAIGKPSHCKTISLRSRLCTAIFHSRSRGISSEKSQNKKQNEVSSYIMVHQSFYTEIRNMRVFFLIFSNVSLHHIII